MKKRELVTKILAGLLVAGMLIGLLPMFVSAEEANTGETTQSGTQTGVPSDPGETDDDLHLSKTAVLQADGTWTITLEAYATGTVTREFKTTVKPTDIILVLDQSGSMDNSGYYISYSGYSVAENVTNQNVINGSYYYYDANDHKYYPVNATKTLVKNDVYWAATKAFTTGEKTYAVNEHFCLESDADGKVSTSWTYNGRTTSFETGNGFVSTDYMIYLRTRTNSGFNRRYNYQLVQQNGSNITNGGNAFDSGYQNSNTALQELVNKYSDYQVDSVTVGGNTYAIVYKPLHLEDDSVYTYTFTYTDDKGQVWTLGSCDAEDEHAFAFGKLYTLSAGRGPRLNALKNSATTFINNIHSAAVSQNVDHHIAVVGFASSSDYGNYGAQHYYSNAEVFVGGTQYNYVDGGRGSSISSGNYYASGKLKTGDQTDSIYRQALQNANTTTGYNNLLASVGALAASGGTFPSHGFEMAIEIAKVNQAQYASGERDLIVVFMTDGEPGWSGFDDGEANAAITQANILKNTYEAEIHTVALLDTTPTDGDDEDSFLNAVTSDGITGTDGNKYYLAKDGVDLTNFFETIKIHTSTSVSTVTLSKNAFLVDRVSEYFNMPAGITKDNMAQYVTIYTADHLGNNEFGPYSDPIAYEVAASVDTENTLSADKIHAWLTYGGTDGLVHGITVHNFDYLSDENMVTTEYWAYKDTNDNDVYDEGVETLVPIEQATAETDHYTMTVSGKKLKILITGVTAKDGAALDYYIDTNNNNSGLWDLAANGSYGMLEAFPMPHAMLGNRIYVLDYAKDACLATLDHTRNALALDSAKDSVMNPVDIHDEADKKLSTTDANPAVQFGDVYIKEEGGRSKVYYTPKTTNWYGYDTFYVFWQGGNEYDSSGNLVWSEGDPVTGYCWSKVNVMPANNVYYEDTFVTTSTDGTTETGRVGIDFGTGWSFTTVDSNGDPAEGSNTESPESAGQEATTGTHGWVESLADDTGFTDGTVAVGDGAKKATATFTFTGTGVDLYSYTDSKVGTVMVKVKPIDVREGYNVPTRYFIVDNYSASGDYYSIPTVSYLARGTKLAYTDENGTEHAEEKDVLVYGKYEVTITVTTAAIEDGGRVTYYLDGIRVYNPLGSEQENNPTVGEGYGDEVHAFFYNIRDYLIGKEDFLANSTNPGAVFIDEIKKDQVEGETVGEGVTTTVIGTYKDYGPKNEVYLAENQMIVMKVDILAGRKYFVSLKAPTGTATIAEISNTDATKATVTVGHTADLYYEVVPTPDANDPSVGYIAIRNAGTELLSVTKFQITGLDPNPTDDHFDSTGPDTGSADSSGTANQQSDSGAVIQQISNDEAVTYARTFALMRSVPYVPSDNESETEDNTEEQVPVEPEVPEIEITNPEVDPEPETPDEPSAEEQAMAMVKALVDKLFKSVIEWFNA